MVSAEIAVIGECMIEVKPDTADKFTHPMMSAQLRYGGDTLNASVYMARQGVAVDYVTALGDDPVSDWMIKQWREEGVGCELVERVAGAVPGLYLIDLDASGERSFYYWRDQSPARQIFDDPPRASALYDALLKYPYIYLSGITLALYKPDVHASLFRFLDDYRAQGGKVAFDNNYRPRQWGSRGAAQSAFDQMYQRSDIAMPTIDDEVLLYGATDAAQVIARLKSVGVGEVVAKQGADGCIVATNADTHHVAAAPVARVVDTTAAGDSFNAGYLAARFQGCDPVEAAAKGNALAAQVVQQPGAIIPR